ncbi:hypothetical protein GCM10027161_32740 [Microbispora hainanensis]
MVWPLQSHSCTWVPSEVLAFGTSRQRPEATPLTAPLPPPGVGDTVGLGGGDGVVLGVVLGDGLGEGEGVVVPSRPRKEMA